MGGDLVTRRSFAREGRGYFAIGIWHPKHEVNVGSLWRSASLFGAAYVFTLGRRYARQASDTPRTPLHVPLLHFGDVEDLVAHLPHSCPLVGVELDPRAQDLDGFTHPERAAYLLGAEDHGLPLAVLDRCHYLVQVETAAPESMNVACAGSILLHARHVSMARKAVSVP
jgi:tRNA G18 (ribose-2'-O)-methylase SpoU